MRKYLLLIVSIALSAYSSGQTILTFEKHAFVVGDNHDFYLAKSADEGKSGANITWDFSDLVPSGNLTSHMIDPSTTLKGSMVNEANLALVEDANVFYFKVSKDGMQQYGTAAGNSLSTYNDPFVKIKYPFSFGDVYSGNYDGKIETTAPVVYGGKFLVEGDAWGTLILPNGVYHNTLRVKQTLTFSQADSSNKEITYRWYCSSVRYPLLVIIKYENQCKSTLVKVAYYAHSSNENTASESNANSLLTASQDIEVYPNPITNLITVNYQVAETSKVSIDLYDASGAIIRNFMPPVTKEAGKYSDNFNISKDLPTGYYFVKTTIAGQTIVKKVVKMKN
jgi:hypothetical protein